MDDCHLGDHPLWLFFLKKMTGPHTIPSCMVCWWVLEDISKLFFGSLKCTDNKSLPQSHSFFLGIPKYARKMEGKESM
jgi:hypothetical protein